MSADRRSRRARHLRHHRRPGAQDDASARSTGSSGAGCSTSRHRGGGRRLDRRSAARARARVDRARPASRSTTPCSTRFAARLQLRRAATSTMPQTYAKRRARARRAPATPPSTSRSRRRCSARVVAGLAKAGLWSQTISGWWSRSRSATTSRRRATLAARAAPATSTSPSSTGSTTSSGRWGSRRSSTCGSRTRCSSPCGTATTSRSRPDHDGRERSASRIAGASTTRSGRCATSSSTTCSSCSPRLRWSRPRAAIRTRSRTPSTRCSARCRDAEPAHYVRGQYDGYRDIDGVAPDSTTETYAALRLEIDNWRWAGVPFFIRTGKQLAVRQTEVRLAVQAPPAAVLHPDPATAGRRRTRSCSRSTRRPGSG